MGLVWNNLARGTLGALALTLSACALHDPAPDGAPGHRQVRLAAERGQWDRAAEVMGVQLETATEDGERPGPEPCLATARALRKDGDEEGARAVLDLALDEFPGHPELLELRAETLIALDFRHAAERDLEECLAGEPTRLSAWLRLGELRLELGLPTAAARALRECKRLGATGFAFDLFAARVHGELDEWADSARYYERVAADPAVPPDLLIEAAAVYANRELAVRDPGGLGRAHAWVARALELDPENAEAHFVRGLLFEAADASSEAVTAYRQALALEPDHLGALTNMAMLCAREKRWELAEEAVRRALELEQSPSRRRALAALVD